ncbi:MAG TPA: P-II family nitrogen regulator [Gemmatimonadaceae bacterium]|jgi:nitrogen regulatory protein P-II 2
MKLVSAIVRPSKLDDVVEALSAIGVTGFTTTEVKGFGRQEWHTEVYQGAEYELTFVPKVKIDTAIPDGLLDKVMETVGKAARTGKIGDGKIMVSALERAICIRTGETNESAL